MAETSESRLSKNVVIAYDGSEHAKNAVKCEYFLKDFINRIHAYIYTLLALLWI